MSLQSNKCRICKANEATLSWQPFGPDDPRSRGAFTAEGFHYRGFPVIRVCADCQECILNYKEVAFTYKGEQYYLCGDDVPLSTFGKELRDMASRLLKMSEEIVSAGKANPVTLTMLTAWFDTLSAEVRHLVELSRKVK